jgi:hypothetical protein
VSCAFKQVRQPVPQQRIIFDDENFHGTAEVV